MTFEVRHLRALCAIASAGSLSRAAADLGMTQPSLSALLQRLEQQLGVSLFLRGHRGVVPTAAGAQIVKRAQIALAEFDRLDADLSGIRQHGRMRIGISQMRCSAALVSRLDDAFPEFETVFDVEGSTTVLAHALDRRFHDLSVITLSDDGEYELPAGVSTRILHPSVPVFVALSAADPLASRDEVALADLAERAWIAPPGADDGSLAVLRALCLAAGFEPNVRFTFAQGDGRALIGQGRAVQLVEPASREVDGMVVRPLVGDPLRLRIALAWRPEAVTAVAAEKAYRVAAQAYAETARRSAAFRGWWRRRRVEVGWVRQLDPVFDDLGVVALSEP
ncbi:LysR family transcriptional regulator [Microbacterium sp. NPDC057944]|uniref:LysR family transcriptional regulator n=1 Tax=Microbacterium sp. NPDC057944 TaxID=3346286 RepID=UPI0036DE7DAA